MKCQFILAGIVLVSSVFALPSSNLVLHEKRHAPLLSRRNRVASDAIIPIRIGLRQSNLESGYGRLMEVSHPSSAKYGQHLSANGVHELFAPDEDSVQTFRHWLLSSGIKEDQIMSYWNKG
jgi:tripeptidyl-peptidase I